MDAAEIQQNLEELDERMERLRALYEQYFCGIERLEPQIPRKDVDRRIQTLRREQIRNTAMRFRFQTLIQRYNTLNQHWTRVLRAIETGTHRRDLAKAAARFGVDAALQGAGKKAKGLKAQLEKEAARKQSGVSDRKRRDKEGKDEEYEEVADADLLVEDDDFGYDAPTPPPSRAPSEHPFGVVMPDFDDAPQAPPHVSPPAAAKPLGRGGVGFFRGVRSQATSAASPVEPAGMDPSATGSPATVAEAPKKSGGGLRLGGGPSRRVNQSALERIASSLGQSAPDPASSVSRPPLTSGPIDVELGPEPAARRPLMSNPIEIELPPQQAPAARPVPTARKPLMSSPIDIEVPPAPLPIVSAPNLTPTARKPLMSSPLDIDVPAAPAVAPPSAAAAGGQASGLRPPPKTGAERAAALRPVAKEAPEPKPAPPSAARGNDPISDTRLREIYSDYVNSRRQQQESTAGVTYEKLADSLRSQADKLREKHTARKVDYEVVVKEGKTLIKPIVK